MHKLIFLPPALTKHPLDITGDVFQTAKGGLCNCNDLADWRLFVYILGVVFSINITHLENEDHMRHLKHMTWHVVFILIPY